MNDTDDDASPQDLFESVGNDPGIWATRAEALLTSAAVLDAQYPQVPQNDSSAFYGFFKLHIAAMMLKGMAIECLLKSIWIKHVSPLVVKSKFRSIPSTKDHDLLSLVTALEEHIELGLSQEEAALVAVLSHAITSGRYPLARSISARPTKPDSGEQMKWCKWEIPADDMRFASIVDKLLRHTDEGAGSQISAYTIRHRVLSPRVT
ncbi:MAG: hypothetical protein JW993_04860 [Sedimentisphaerales bacterium]|nr:hypothetical protein [Sedimentisphaerales bacterium]